MLTPLLPVQRKAIMRRLPPSTLTLAFSLALACALPPAACAQTPAGATSDFQDRTTLPNDATSVPLNAFVNAWNANTADAMRHFVAQYTTPEFQKMVPLEERLNALLAQRRSLGPLKLHAIRSKSGEQVVQELIFRNSANGNWYAITLELSNETPARIKAISINPTAAPTSANTTAATAAPCPPAGQTRESLLALKAADWQVADDATRQTLALALQSCLASPDPVLRDEIGFEALSHWMRSAQLRPATLHTIRATQLAQLTQSAQPKPSPFQASGLGESGAVPSGFAQPFAALTLAEVARVDRKQAFLTPEQRQQLVSVATSWLAALRDYRGFDEKDGWRHGVAHGADLMLQLSLNPALDKPQMEAMLAAIATQVAIGPNEHVYRYGEGERLMAPVFYLARRSEIAASEWDAWFTRLLAPLKKGPTTQASLVLRHNLSGFLLPLYFSLQESGESLQKQKMLPWVVRSLKQIE
jgi:hypothetical protein